MAFTNKERQSDEMLVLESIYSTEYEDLTDRSLEGSLPRFKIRLKPRSGNMTPVYASISLCVSFPADYPNVVPRIDLADPEGVSEKQVANLSARLYAKAKKHIGEVCTLQLASEVEDFLEQNNMAQSSFYDQMMSEKERAEREKEEQKRRVDAIEGAKAKQEEEEEERLITEEIRKRSEAQRHCRKRYSSSLEEALEPGCFRTSGLRSSASAPTVGAASTVDGCRVFLMDFPARVSAEIQGETVELLLSSCAATNANHSQCVSLALHPATGEPLEARWWLTEVQPSKKQIKAIKDRVNHLSELATCPPLSLYRGCAVLPTGRKLAILVFTDYFSGVPLEHHLNQTPTNPAVIKEVAKQLLEGLDFLHRKSLAAGNLSLQTVLVNGNWQLKIINYNIGEKLDRIASILSTKDSPSSQTSVKDPLLPAGKQQKAADIFSLGLIVLSLYIGTKCSHGRPEIPDVLPEEVQDFLEMCFGDDPDRCPTVQHLLLHPLLKISRTRVCSSSISDLAQDLGVNTVLSFSPKTYPPAISSQAAFSQRSRLLEEFENFKWLGKGGFGNVIKARNKLDGCVYAIKRIVLGSGANTLKRRIRKEVRFLSRLNHENIVRYFNSWIDYDDLKLSTTESIQDEPATDSSDLPQPLPDPVGVRPRATLEERLMKLHNYDQGMLSSTDQERCSVTPEASSSTSDEATLSRPKTPMVYSPEISFMQFEDVLQQEEEEDSSEEDNCHSDDCESKCTRQMDVYDPTTLPKVLCIQMEYCENNTLRAVIDQESLHADIKRLWRLFRELTEGLAYTHSQHLIHRDLKPGNIFLDAGDRIKIGDFGLATFFDVSIIDSHTASHSFSSADRAGTSLYIAPELTCRHKASMLTEKADMFSLGIIFFEMCHPAFFTGMERIATLTQLRKDSSVLTAIKNTAQISLLNQLLSNEPSRRPTARELLDSGSIPFQMERTRFNDALSHTLSQPGSHEYVQLMKKIVAQKPPVVKEGAYESELYKEGSATSMVAFHSKVDPIVRVLKSVAMNHGAVEFQTPLLIPKTHHFDCVDTVVKLVDQFGTVLVLPYDDRVSICRFIARSRMSSLRRFCLDRVFRDFDCTGAHPRQFWNFSFDIAAPLGGDGSVIEAEVIYFVHETLLALLGAKRFCVQISHASLLPLTLRHFGVEEDMMVNVCAILNETRDNPQARKVRLGKLLRMDGGPDRDLSGLFACVDFEGSHSQALQRFSALLRSKTIERELASAFGSIHAVLSVLKSMPASPTVTVRPDMTYGLNVCSGIKFQAVVENPSSKLSRQCTELVAVGARCDHLVAMFRRGQPTQPTCVCGITFSLEKLSSVVLAGAPCMDSRLTVDRPLCEVVICSMGDQMNSSAMLGLASRLWKENVRTHISYQPALNPPKEGLPPVLHHQSVRCCIVFKDTATDPLRVHIWEKDKFVDYKVPVMDVVGFVLQRLRPEAKDTQDSTSKFQGSSSDLVPSTSLAISSASINFLLADRLAPTQRRLYEIKLQARLAQVLGMFNNPSSVDIVATDLKMEDLDQMYARLDLDGNKADFDCSTARIADLSKQRKQVARICSFIFDLRVTKRRPIIIIYGVKDDHYRIL